MLVTMKIGGRMRMACVRVYDENEMGANIYFFLFCFECIVGRNYNRISVDSRFADARFPLKASGCHSVSMANQRQINSSIEFYKTLTP